MAPINIPWPTQAVPGRRPGDGQGDLINAYAVQIGELIEVRRTPGLVRHLQLADPVARIARGTHSLPGHLLHAWDGELQDLGELGNVIAGSPLPGTDRVTMAHNMRDGKPDVVVCTKAGTFLYDVETHALTPYPDPNGYLGVPNSVEYFAGYFVFTKESGYFVVSDLQNPDLIDDSYGKTEYSADRLWRAKGQNNNLWLMSDRSLEAWVDVATSPMPFTRQAALDIGLFGRYAVAGGSQEWERGLFFVASDFTVRQIDGLTPKIISTDDVSFDIYGCRSRPHELVTQVYTFEQQAVFSITCPDIGWTWEYNVSSGKWHRRDSYGMDFWRGTSAVQFEMHWYVQDLVDGGLLEVAQEIFVEDGERLRYRCESGPMKSFPASMRIPSIDIDCIVALGKTRVPSPFETNPTMMVSWSHDGGANWSRPVARSMGRVGRFANKVTVNNLGRSTHHGTRLRVDIVDPVPATIIGGVSTSVRPSRPRSVDK